MITALDPKKVRSDFPCLSRQLGGRSPVYFDSACVTLKPASVIRSMMDYYEQHPSCHSRSLHLFGREITERYQAARAQIARHLNASTPHEIIFTRNTTEAINLVSRTLRFQPGDVIVTSDLEHNSNLLPWQFLAQRRQLSYKIFSIPPDRAAPDLEELEGILKEGRVRLISTFFTSQVTGISLPISEITRLAHRYGAFVLVDGAQALATSEIDVRKLDIDFFACSFHKAFGPSGMGALYGKQALLQTLEPFLSGGETVIDATLDSCVLAPVPERFEAGLQNYSGALGSAEALKYIRSLGFGAITAHIQHLNERLTERLSDCSRIRILGPPAARARGGLFNFAIKGMDSAELAVLLDKSHGIMTRSGVHCSHAWYRKYGLSPSLRVAISVYNTEEDIDLLAHVLRKLDKYF